MNKNILLLSSSIEDKRIDRYVIDIAIALKNKDFNVIVASAGGKMVKELKKANIPHHFLPINSNDFLVSYKCLKNLKNIVLKNKIKIVHSFSPETAYHGYKLSKTTNAIHFTSIYKVYKKSIIPFSNKGINYMLKANFIITPSKYMEQHLVSSYKINPNKIGIVPAWIDTDLYNPNAISAERIITTATGYRIPEDSFIVTTISNLKNTKDLTFLISSIIKLQDISKKKIRCIILNNQTIKNKNRLENIITKLNANHLIHIIEDKIDIPAILMLSDVYVKLNSKGKAYMPTILEAEGLGRPIIATDTGSTKEYIFNEEICKLIKSNDSEKFIKELLNTIKLTKDERFAISQKLSTYIRLNFSKNYIPEKIITIYNCVLDKINN